MFDFTIYISEKWLAGVIAGDETVVLISGEKQTDPFYFDYILDRKGSIQFNDMFMNKYDVEVLKIRLNQYLNGN